jgi:hypothetical protein
MKYLSFVNILFITLLTSCKNEGTKSYSLPEALISERNAHFSTLPYNIKLEFFKTGKKYQLTPVLKIIHGKPFNINVAEPEIFVISNGKQIYPNPSESSHPILITTQLKLTAEDKIDTTTEYFKPYTLDLPIGSIAYCKVYISGNKYYPDITLYSPIIELK